MSAYYLKNQKWLNYLKNYWLFRYHIRLSYKIMISTNMFIICYRDLVPMRKTLISRPSTVWPKTEIDNTFSIRAEN